MNPGFFVTGIGTDVGKTFVSAAICVRTRLPYWKPIQCGSSDQNLVQELSIGKVETFPVVYDFPDPLSPHHAASLVQETVSIEKILMAAPIGPCLIEGAGGLLVPLNEKQTMLDLIQALRREVILVSRHYIGCINHTLLTLRVLQEENIPVRGIVFNGDMPEQSEAAILGFSPIPLKVLARIPDFGNEPFSFSSWSLDL